MPRPARRPSPRLGQYLRRCREEAGLALADVAEMSREHPESISVSYLSKTELGRFTPPLGMLMTLASVYGVPLQHLIDYALLDRVAPEPPASDDPEVLRTAGLEAIYQGRVYHAYACFEKAIDLLGSSDDVAVEAERHLFVLRMASALRHMGMHSVVRHILDRLLAETDVSPAVQVHALYRLAVAYFATGGLPQAMGMALQARVVLDSSTFSERERLSYDVDTIRARILRSNGDLDGAAELQRSVLSGLESIGAESDAVMARQSLARVLVVRGDVEEGLQEHRRAMFDARRLGNERLRCRTRLSYGVSCFEIGRLDEAREELVKALRVAREYSFVDHQFDAYFHLWKYHTIRGDESSAATHFRALCKLRTRIQGQWDVVREFDELARQKRD